MVRASVATALVLLSALLPPSGEALRSDLGGRKLAASTNPPAPSTQPSSAVVATPNREVHTNSESDKTKNAAEDEDDGAVVRCRFCGAAVAVTADYVGLHDTTKAVGSKAERVLGPNGELHTFTIPTRVEVELAGFKKTLGVEVEQYTKKPSFFDHYNWRDVHCPSCKRHIGWKFHHDDLQYCINAQTIETLAAFARAQQHDASAVAKQERRAQIVDEAFGSAPCVGATHGWWSYEVCYKREVRQFHEEPDGQRPSDWSMGKFVPFEQATDAVVGTLDTPTDLPSSDIVHSFQGGQPCDENGEQRNTRVTYKCCKSRPAEIAIDAIAEPSLCSYVIAICVPSLCDKTADAQALESALAAQRHADVCEREMVAGLGSHQDAPPLSFTALRWSTVISEASSELDWARNLQFKA